MKTYQECILLQAEINVLGYEIGALDNLIEMYTNRRTAKIEERDEKQAEFDDGCVPLPPTSP